MRHCRHCGTRIPPRPPGTPGKEPGFCTENCRKRYWEQRDPDDRTDDASVLAVRRRLERAVYATERCGCEWPLAALDEDDVWRCVKCARPLAPAVAAPRHELPPAARVRGTGDALNSARLTLCLESAPRRGVPCQRVHSPAKVGTTCPA